MDLPSPVREKNRTEAQTQAHTCQSRSSGADQVTLVPRFRSADRLRRTQTTPPDHMFLLKDQSVSMVLYLLTDAPKIAI